mgnify:CR=1 FL=1
MKRLREEIGSFTADNLFYDASFPVQTAAVKLAAGKGVVLRGTAIGKNDAGEYEMASATIPATAILCDNVDTGETAGTAIVAETYSSGSFNSKALIVDGDIAAHADELRKNGIYIKAML